MFVFRRGKKGGEGKKGKKEKNAPVTSHTTLCKKRKKIGVPYVPCYYSKKKGKRRNRTGESSKKGRRANYSV